VDRIGSRCLEHLYIDSVAVAAKLVSGLPSTISIGVRLFGRFEEIATLFGSIDVERDIHGVTPVWIFVKDGNVERVYLGPHLGEEGEKRLYRRVLGWLHGEPKEHPPSDLARLVRWVRSLWSRKQN
jgi:hypothetical protein